MSANAVEAQLCCAECGKELRETMEPLCAPCVSVMDFSDVPGDDPSDAASALVSDWFERRKLIGGLSADVIREFELCIDDLEAR